MELHNSTHLDSATLERLFQEAVADWPHDGMRVFVRYSRGSDFSGSCYYRPPRIHINLGRRNRYPYAIRTQIARARSDRRSWWRELYEVEAADAVQLAFFLFMHEFYHWLVRKARRNSRQKEGRCDRFAVRGMVERWGVIVRDTNGRAVPRGEWDFQDLDGFVAAARRTGVRNRIVRTIRPAVVASAAGLAAARIANPANRGGQLLLFPVE
ncbi:MAG TPA: hypothetical protein VJZ71_15780 [Phycisphaerae bacterium]|nr:hypothetical protein [Phycisphaerae bacterium]